jgi:hypothetical protein
VYFPLTIISFLHSIVSTLNFAIQNTRQFWQAGGTTLVGYKDRLRWAVFDPEAGKLHHGDRGDAPDTEGLADGFGYDFCPFWKAKEAELTHCLRLADWWLAVLKKVQSNMGHVHQVGSGVSYSSGSKARRLHRLISEASPDLPPNGFFDCTVEVSVKDKARHG